MDNIKQYIFECNKCKKKFKSKEYLASHNSLYHKNDEQETSTEIVCADVVNANIISINTIKNTISEFKNEIVSLKKEIEKCN